MADSNVNDSAGYDSELQGDLDILDGDVDDSKDDSSKSGLRSPRTSGKKAGRGDSGDESDEDSDDDGDDEESGPKGRGRKEKDGDDDEGEDLDEEDKEEEDKEEDEDEDEDKDKRKVKGKDKDEEDEEESKEEDLDEKVHKQPSIKAIKKYDKDFFKKFPEVRHAIFRARAYTEVFPTVDDAKTSIEKNKAFDNVVKVLDSGDPAQLFEMVARKNPEIAYNHIVSFLPQLYKANKDLFHDITNPVIKAMLRHAKAEAKRSNNEDLENSAWHLHKFLFQDEDFDKQVGVTGPKRSNDDPERKKLDTERQTWMRNQFDSASHSILKESDEIVEDTISEKLKASKIEPTKSESRNMRRDVQEKLDRALKNDVAHLRLMDSLWKKAENSGYSSEAVARIKRAYTQKIELLLPGIITKVQREVFEGRRKFVKREKEDEATTDGESRDEARNEPRVSSGKAASGEKRSGKEIDWSKTSDEDYLNDRITYKK